MSDSTNPVALIKDIKVGTSGSGPDDLINVDGQIFFFADDGENGDAAGGAFKEASPGRWRER